MKWHNLLCCLLFSLVGFTQQYPSTQFSNRDILPNNTVRTLFIAGDGALWIGTDNGLVRKFNDQVDFYFKEDGLTQNNIWAIDQDGYGNIWIGSYGKGLSTFKDNKIIPYAHNDQLPDQEVTRLFIQDEYLYVGTSDGLAVIDMSLPDRIITYDPNPDDTFNIQGFLELKNQVYVITYDDGIYKVALDEDKISLNRIWAEKHLYGAYQYKDSIYLSGKQYYKTVPAASFTDITSLRKMKPQGRSIFWDYEPFDDRLFAAGWGIYLKDGGIYELMPDGFELRNEFFGVESTQVTSLAMQREFGLLYVGTLDNGFYEIRLDQSVSFEKSNHDRIVDFAQLDSDMITLYNDALQIDSITIEANLFKKWLVDYVKSNPDNLPKYEDYFYELKYDTPATDIVFYSVKENSGTIWVNTSIGMYQFDESGALINYMPVHALEFNFTADGKLLEPNFYHGTRVYDSVSPMRYIYYDESKSLDNPRFVVGSFQDGPKTYLTSIFNGLYVYEDGQFTSLAENNTWKEKRLRFITGLNDGRKAVTNEDGDVFIINDDSTFKASQIHRDPSHGKTITFLSSYKDFIILGTSQGIVFHNGEREIFLNQEQGIDAKIYKGFVNDGILHLASDYGSYSIQLDAVLNQKSRADHIGLQSFKINNKEFKAAEIVNGKINLNHDQNSLDLQLSTNNHPFPGKLKYSYRLNENDSWIELSDNKLMLPFLDSGNYQLFVQIDDASTGYKMDQKILEFHIAKPFYKSNLFLALIFLVSMAILIVYFRLKRKRAYQTALEKESVTKRIEEVKMEALLSQMNPHFIFNSLNSVQYFISNNENDRAMKYLSTFSDLIRANLHNTERPLISLEDEIAYLKRYIDLENARFSDRIEVTFIIDPELSLTQTHIPTMILQPFVENAFIHAVPSRIELPQIRIEFTIIDSQLYQCTITDNGIGEASFNKNKHHVSKGTQLVQERLSFLGYDPEKALQISYTQHGTLVKFELER